MVVLGDIKSTARKDHWFLKNKNGGTLELDYWQEYFRLYWKAGELQQWNITWMINEDVFRTTISDHKFWYAIKYNRINQTMADILRGQESIKTCFGIWLKKSLLSLKAASPISTYPSLSERKKYTDWEECRRNKTVFDTAHPGSVVYGASTR